MTFHRDNSSRSFLIIPDTETENFAQAIETNNPKDLELMIRSSAERRISNPEMSTQMQGKQAESEYTRLTVKSFVLPGIKYEVGDVVIYLSSLSAATASSSTLASGCLIDISATQNDPTMLLQTIFSTEVIAPPHFEPIGTSPFSGPGAVTPSPSSAAPQPPQPPTAKPPPPSPALLLAVNYANFFRHRFRQRPGGPPATSAQPTPAAAAATSTHPATQPPTPLPPQQPVPPPVPQLLAPPPPAQPMAGPGGYAPMGYPLQRMAQVPGGGMVMIDQRYPGMAFQPAQAPPPPGQVALQGMMPGMQGTLPQNLAGGGR
ncbi:hypothetical protein PAPYR_5774 [Paratrimastix pyriformis]|uniref:Uncharacterized protein n=1 Tax=Paratrimastix pyriformis TaxID=342808 RepID=A0ABQ8UM50_9EUKA|nr:hypothetical protein PAPYR_5774 [Paratrimastix pyriformis]